MTCSTLSWCKDYKEKPDYGRCVAIVASASLREMIKPGALAIASPIAVGGPLFDSFSFLFFIGPNFFSERVPFLGFHFHGNMFALFFPEIDNFQMEQVSSSGYWDITLDIRCLGLKW